MKKQPQRRLWDRCESLALPSDSEPQNFGLHIKRGKWIEARVKAIHYAAGSQTGAVRYELDRLGPGTESEWRSLLFAVNLRLPRT